MSSRSRLSSKRLLAAALAVGLALAPAIAEARAGGGSSFGSRGSRSFSPPPITNTAPRQASPFQPGASQFNPRPAATAQKPGFFGTSFGRGLMGGLLGAGLFGLLFGHGLFGGLGGIMSILGLILQVVIVVFVARLAFAWFNSRRQPAMAGAAPRTGFGFGGDTPTGSAGYGAAAPPPVQPIQPQEADFAVFEQRLADVQAAYGRDDAAALRNLATPQMATELADQLADNARKGVINKVSDAHLLQGDLSEAWSEEGFDYATVAMRYSLVDVTLDRVTGRVIEGDATRPSEATELWTFVRPLRGAPQDWKLSAIQQS
jgi:predicted lipid-binding transport protein (Tim44 family)